MYKEKKIAVVIPCYNEETQIENVLKTIPPYIDLIIIIDDCSTDNTVKKIESISKDIENEISLIKHKKNQGVGGAIASGYKKSIEENMDAVAVMAGDGQMDPSELHQLLDPVVNEDVDYTKGNRLFTGDAWYIIPRVRYLGNSALSMLTKIASGYWHIADSQSGYTVINRSALNTINWDLMYKRYGQPNDLLVRLNIYNFKVRDIPIKPIYNIGEKSGIKPIRLIPRIGKLIFKLFFYRMLHKYIIRDFHPLVFFYMFALIFVPCGSILGTYLLAYRIISGPIAETSALFAAFLTITGFQNLFFGMWLDMESNKNLR